MAAAFEYRPSLHFHPLCTHTLQVIAGDTSDRPDPSVRRILGFFEQLARLPGYLIRASYGRLGFRARHRADIPQGSLTRPTNGFSNDNTAVNKVFKSWGTSATSEAQDQREQESIK